MCACLYSLTTCLLKFVNFRLRDVHIRVLRYNGTLSDWCVAREWHRIIDWYRIMDW